MTHTTTTRGPLALKLALAIIGNVGNPAPGRPAQPVTAGELAGIIQDELDRTVMRKATQEAMELIESHDGDMLTDEERGHPRGNGWARVYDQLARARYLLVGGDAA